MNRKLVRTAAAAALTAGLLGSTATASSASVTNSSSSRTSVWVVDDGRGFYLPPNRHYPGSAETVCFRAPAGSWDNVLWRGGIPIPRGAGCTSALPHALNIAVQR